MSRSDTLKVFLPLTFVGLLFACSTQKDTFINRNHHALNTKFNVLHNGKMALEEGRQGLILTYTDNFWEVLPVERLEVSEEIQLSGEAKNPLFERAEEKATKAIQKHSMNINGRERNPQMDEAYLLLGKARYYDQRFVPALEAFNYILHKYLDSDRYNETLVWREKTNIRLENEEVAIKNLRRLLRQEKLKEQVEADARASMAQAYVNLKIKDTAIMQLKIAAELTRDKEEKGRYYYILGQLYNELGIRDTANMAFDKVIALNRKTSRNYLINAYIEKAKNFDVEGREHVELLELLTKLEKNRENRPYLDKIYRQLGMYYLEEEDIFKATAYLEQSLRTGTRDAYLKALNYEDLAEINFDLTGYKEAGAYYDSTLMNLPEKTVKYRVLKRKRENLDDVIAYEQIAKQDDSLLAIINMSDFEKERYYRELINALIAQEELQKQQQEDQERTADFAAIQPESRGVFQPPDYSKQFYFYNTVTASFGYNEFRKIWGDRPLTDNWRLGNQSGVSQATYLGTAQDSVQVVSEARYQVSYYLERLPSDPEEVDSIKQERDFAYYQLGLIYKEKFKEYLLAVRKLEDLLKFQPEEKLVLPAKYNLYKIYQIMDDPRMNAVKEDIITDHPGSRYAQILQNPGTRLRADENSPDSKYKEAFTQFEDQQYESCIALCDESILRFTGEDIVPKFELLKASAIGRLDGYEDYKDALNEVALNYPNDPEGKAALKKVNEDILIMSATALDTTKVVGNTKLLYPFSRTETGVKNIQEVTKTIEQAFKDLYIRDRSLSIDVYDRETLFLVVHGFRSLDLAKGFAELLSINKDYLVKHESVAVLSSNYRIIQVHKNLDQYIQQIPNPLE